MYHKQLKQLPFFRNIDSSLLVDLASFAVLKYYKKGEMLFIHGDNTEYFYIINSGWIKLFRNTSDGQEALLGLAKSGDIVGEVDFNKTFHSSSAQIVNESEILLLPYKLLIENIKNNGILALNILKALNFSISLLELQLEHISTMNAAQRIGCFILRLCGNNKETNEIRLPYEKMLIASYLGMKRETFSRGLHALEAVGVSINGHILSIANMDELIKFCCVSCSLSHDTCC